MKSINAILIIFIILISCSKQKSKQLDYSNEKLIVEETIENTIAWIKNKDTSLLYSIIADDENYLEVQPNNNVVVGINQFKQAESFWLNERFQHVGFETWDMHINFSGNGQLAWFYCMLNDLNTWDGKPASWENTRWTGVLEKRNEKWRMVQMHFSKAQE